MTNTFVFDTNALVSAHILPTSISRKALEKSDQLGILVYSTETIREFATVFMRHKFDRYQSPEARLNMISLFEKRNQLIKVTEVVTASRDSTDNMFLGLALSCKAKAIITGDPDLLVLHPFQGIPIMNAATFLSSF